MRNLKRVIIYFIVTLTLIVLPGCSIRSSFINKLEEEYKEELRQSDESYFNYEKNEKSGNLDSDNHYKTNDELVTGQIEISFFRNNHLTANYYYDEDRTELVNQSNCFLNPGDSLYADYPKVINQDNSKYGFSKFVVYSFIENTKKEVFASCETDGKIFTIPKAFTGDHLSVMAIGEYKERELNFSAYVYQNEELVEIPNNIWKVNGKEYKNSHVTIGSSKPYKVKYDYSQYNDEFYFYESTPKQFNYNDSLGLVEFNTEDVSSLCDNYSVTLKPYKTLNIENKTKFFLSNGHIKSLVVNGEETEDVTKDKYEYCKLKPGNKVVIRLDKGYRAISNYLESSKPISSNEYVEYTFSIIDNDQLDLKIVCEEDDAKSGAYEQKHIDNASINIYHLNNQVIKPGESIDDSEKILVEIVPNDGYYITGKNVKNNSYSKTMKYKDYVSDIDEIVVKHEIKKYIIVYLETKDKCGTVAYTYDKKGVSNQIRLKEGDEIECKYTITDSNYTFEDSNVFERITKTVEKTIDIKIESNMDCKTIKASDYIKLKKK